MSLSYIENRTGIVWYFEPRVKIPTMGFWTPGIMNSYFIVIPLYEHITFLVE